MQLIHLEAFFAILALFLGLQRQMRLQLPNRDAIETHILVLGNAFLHVALVAFFFACVGYFSIHTIWITTALVGSLYMRLPGNPAGKAGKLDLVSLGVLAAIFILAAVFSPAPAEWLSNYHMDAGRYSNSASFILSERGLVIEHSIPEAGKILTEADVKFVPGFHPSHAGDTFFVAPYLHLYPVTFALFRAHTSILNSFTFNWFVGILSALLLYVLLIQSSNSRILAIGGAILLFTNAACQLFYIRSMSEAVTQVLVLLFFANLVQASKKYGSYFMGSTCLTLVALAVCRLEFGILYGLLPGIVFVSSISLDTDSFARRRTFLLLAVAGLIPVSLYYLYCAPAYANGNSYHVLKKVFGLFDVDYRAIYPWGIQIWLLVQASVLVLLLGFSNYLEIWRDGFLKHVTRKSLFSGIIATIFGLFLIWNATLRPLGGAIPNPLFKSGFSTDYVNLLRLLWFFDPLMLLSSVFGVFLYFKKDGNKAYGLFALTMIFLTIFRATHSTPVFWWIRRYVQVVIPGLYFFGVLGLLSTRPVIRHAVLLIALSFNIFTNSVVTRNIVEHEGLFDFYSQFAKRMSKSKSIQLCFNADNCNKAAVPLNSHFQIPTVYLTAGLNERKVQFMQSLIDGGYKVFVTDSSLTPAPFTPEDLGLLTEHSLLLKHIRSKTFTSPNILGFNRGWSLETPWYELYLPAPLFGLAIRDRWFPAKLYRIKPINGNRDKSSKNGNPRNRLLKS